jgi:ketosteroid isomerase-like protein
MRKLAVILALLTVAASSKPVDRSDEVRATEIAFAKAFADRDSAKFFDFLTDDAHFLGGKRAMNNRTEVETVWSNYFKDAKAPFRWEPERVVVNAKGDLGLSTGPVYDAEGKHISNYSSIWQRQSNGRWKIVFDGPGGAVCDTTK